MIEGVVRDGHPRIRLSLPGFRSPFETEFLVDTGFADELSLPSDLSLRLDATPSGSRRRRLADGSFVLCAVLLFHMEWDGDEREVEVLVLEGEPLAGTQFFRDMHLHVELSEGGQVLIEPL